MSLGNIDSEEELAAALRRRLGEAASLRAETVDEDSIQVLEGAARSVWPEICEQIPDPFFSKQQHQEMKRRIALAVVERSVQVLNGPRSSGPASRSRLAVAAAHALNITKLRRIVVEAMKAQPANRTGDADSEATRWTAAFWEAQLPARASAMPPLPVPTPPRALPTGAATPGSVRVRALTAGLGQTRAGANGADLGQPPSPRPPTDARRQSSASRIAASYAAHAAPTPPPELAASSPPARPRSASHLAAMQYVGAATVALADPVPAAPPLPGMTPTRTVTTRARSGLERDMLAWRSMGRGSVATDSLDPLLQAVLAPIPPPAQPAPAPSAAAITHLTVQGQPHPSAAATVDSPAEPARYLRKRRDGVPTPAVALSAAESQDLRAAIAAAAPHPSAMLAGGPAREVLRVANYRVSDRVARSVMMLPLALPLANEFLPPEELDPEVLSALDGPLDREATLCSVFAALSAATARPFMSQEADLYGSAGLAIRPAPAGLPLHACFASARLPPADVLQLNPVLVGPPRPPGPPRTMSYLTRPEPVRADAGHPADSRRVREYTSWLRWWQSAVHPDDYMQFLADRETDFLSVLFHLYPDSEPDDRALQDDRVRAHAEALARAAREQAAAKAAWSAGHWNALSVELGGLGWAGQEGSAGAVAEAHARLAAAAARLRLAPTARMDLSIKYSSATAAPLVVGRGSDQVVVPAPLVLAADLWTAAAAAVMAREAVLARLEALERLASDPARLLAKGASATSRLAEERARATLDRELTTTTLAAAAAVDAVADRLGDVVTFAGRPYREKMATDRREMLYWLQQERRQARLPTAATALSATLAPAPPPGSNPVPAALAVDS